MAQIRHIATSKRATTLKLYAVIVELSNDRFLYIRHVDRPTFNSETAIKSELERQAGQSLENLFVHVNRDGSIALAYGQEPDVWPEDRPDPLEVIPDNLKEMLEDQPTNKPTHQQQHVISNGA